MNRLEGKVALVTGATQGMGRAVADLFHANGATVLGADVHPPNPDASPYAIRKLDVADPVGWKALLAEIEETYGRLDILVNNAGIIGYEPYDTESMDSWLQVVSVNLTGLWLGMQACTDLMRRSRAGSIVNFSSIWGNVGISKAASYHASKGGVRTLTKHAAIRLAPDGIRVNSIHPGFIDTPLTRAQSPSVNDAVIAATPLGRGGTATEVAYGVLYLASDESSYVTGTELIIDGGYLAQ